KDVSQINGTLRVTPDGGHANFYLLNPNGVLFGKGASIDVPGDFHVTTAHFIKFQDGAKYGSDPVHSRLTSAAPASFGFTSGTKANNILLGGKGAIVVDGANLDATSSQKSIDLVANKITIENGAKISSQSSGGPKDAGDIRLVAAKGDTNVTLKRDAFGNLELPKFAPTTMNAGKVLIDGKDKDGNITTVVTRGDGGGRVAAWGGEVQVSNGGKINIQQTGSTDPYKTSGAIIHASNLRMENGGVIETDGDSSASGKGANISIHSGGAVNVLSDSKILTVSPAKSVAGDILVRSTGAINVNGQNGKGIDIGTGVNLPDTEIQSGGSARLSSNDYININKAFLIGGNVNIESGSILLSHDAGIYGLTLRLLAEDMALKSSTIQAIASNNRAASVSIKTNFIELGGGEPGLSPSSISAILGTRPRVDLMTRDGLVLKSGSDIFSYTSESKGGEINIIDGGDLLIIGDNDSNSMIQTFNPKGSSGISYPGGEINVKAQYIYLDRGSIVASTDGKGGSVKLNIEDIFTKSNILNGKLFVSDGNIPKYTKGGKGQYSKGGNYIVIENDGGDSDVAISGSLLNLNGAMANLGTPSFESDALSNSCDVIDKGSLMSGGKGGKGLDAMDRMIFGE
ncbi:MAG: filamentous hemagglutinin N-terminal domain-containing protein, partial [Gammaproteobacteria bacterium]|nr:filamentous hemagglutinin N-terminal domain-containing protein [Gammaproteobacteria bacterium]